jgi:CubicO group peptidase (beta-lactamase class C family)
MKRKIFIGFGIFLLLIFLYLIISPSYVRKALIYQKVGIEDYPIFHNREIKTGEYQEWEVDSLCNTYELSYYDDSVLNHYESVAFLVIKNKKILFEKYWEGFSEDSISNSFSMAKSVISLMIGIAIDEGKIESVDQKVVDVFPEFNTCEANASLTIKDVLTMSSGLNWDESYGSLYSTTTEAYYGKDIFKQIVELEVVEESGKEFKYLSGNTQLLGLIIQSATGEYISNYASEKIWKKIGAKNPALWSLDKENGIEKAYCCFNSNAQDFARIGQLILNNGMWDSTQIVSSAYVEKSISPANYIVDSKGEEVDFYGYQWWILNYKGSEIPYARGILGQYIYILKEKDAIVVRLGHKRDKEYIGPHTKDAFEYLDIALKIIEKYEN